MLSSPLNGYTESRLHRYGHRSQTERCTDSGARFQRAAKPFGRVSFATFLWRNKEKFQYCLTASEKKQAAGHEGEADIFIPAEGDFFAAHEPERVDERGDKKLRNEYNGNCEGRAEAFDAEHDGKGDDQPQHSAEPV